MADSPSWQTLSVRVPDPLVKEALIGEFSSDGIAGVWERGDPDEGLDLVFYFQGDRLPPLARARVRRTFERNGYPVPEIRVSEQGQADWNLEWRRGFSAFPLGHRFRVVPSWEEVEAADPRMTLRIDPGMAFGTGTHETTQMVIEALEEENLERPILDLGSGSGILAIAASRLGAPQVIACDVEPDAAHVARGNFDKNGVVVGLFVGSVDAVRTHSVGLVLANLTAEVLVTLAGELARVLAPSGRAVLSGVLSDRAMRLEDALFRVGLIIRRRVHRGEWVTYLVSAGGD